MTDGPKGRNWGLGRGLCGRECLAFMSFRSGPGVWAGVRGEAYAEVSQAEGWHVLSQLGTLGEPRSVASTHTKLGLPSWYQSTIRIFCVR